MNAKHRATYRSLPTATRRTAPARRSAFTIVELIVSIGILGILLVMAGSIFTLTLKSSGQATALIEVSESIRAVEDALREDLRYVEPGRSIMLIQGNRMNAKWTADEKELADPGKSDVRLRFGKNRDPERETIDAATGDVVYALPRGDKLLFFTARPGTSFTDSRVSGRLQMVVYGHATIQDLNDDGSSVSVPGFTPDGVSAFANDYNLRYDVNNTTGMLAYSLAAANNSSPAFWGDVAPAQEWLLARRSVLIVDQNLVAGSGEPNYYPAASLDDDADVVSLMSGTDPQYSIPKDGYILDGRRDYIINGNEFDYERDVVQLQPVPTYDVTRSNPGSLIRLTDPSRIDPAPPYSQSKRLGHYLLPNCASFKVEWALDVSDVDYGPHRDSILPGAGQMIWIDPARFAETVVEIQSAFQAYYDDVCEGDHLGICAQQVRAISTQVLGKLVPLQPDVSIPTTVPCNNLDRQTYFNNCLAYHSPGRFAAPRETGGVDLTVLNAHVFYTQKPSPPCIANFNRDPDECVLAPPAEPDPLFPKALRITIDVYDSAGRLDKPIRHVMVLPVGGE